MTRTTNADAERICELLSTFKLPTVAAELVRRLVGAGLVEALPVVCEVLEQETHDRKERRIERLRKASKLPLQKTFATLDLARFPKSFEHRIRELCNGAFVERADNVLCFGLPGYGKTHVACALGHTLVEHGHAVIFYPAYQLVQELLAAKRDLSLPKMLRSLDAFDVLIVDDIGYVQHSSDEAEVLFTLLSERYERKSVVITSNLVFSQWDRIFKNPMATAAAIDRVVHHSTILEFPGPSVRAQAAKQRATTTDDNNEETKTPTKISDTDDATKSREPTRKGR